MLVANWMSKTLVTLDPDSTMSQAARLIREHHISHLPVIDKNGRLKGIVSDRDVKRASASDATTLSVHELAYLLSRMKIIDIMTRDPVTVGPYDTVEEAAMIMLERGISGMPVVDDSGAVVAMITQSDIFRALISLTGVTHGGIQFALDLEDRPGSIKEATDVIRQYGGRMVSILTTYDEVPDGKRRVFIRAKNLDRAKVPEIKRELSAKGDLLYILDSRLNKKEPLLGAGLLRRVPAEPAAHPEGGTI